MRTIRYWVTGCIAALVQHMDDEKYPKQISSIQITDIKQIIPILPGAPQISRSECSSDTLRSDPVVVDFLTNLGASLFSQALNSRNVSLRLLSLSNISTAKSFTLHEADSTLPENVPEEPNQVRKKEIIQLRRLPNAPPASSMPSHRVQIIPESMEKKIINQTYLDNKATLVREKRFKVSREINKSRQEKMQRALNKATLKNTLSLRINQERQLVDNFDNRKSLWLSNGKVSRFSQVPIVIVGGGIAGLSAAHHLLMKGFSNVTILEASNRLGGRIHSVNVKSLATVIELGVDGVDVPAENKDIYKVILNSSGCKGIHKEPRLTCRIAGDSTSQLSSRALRFAKLIDKDMKLVTTMLSADTGSSAPINLSYDSYVTERHRRLLKDNLGFSEPETDLLRCVGDYNRYTFGDDVGDSAVQWLDGQIMKQKIILPMGFSSVVRTLTKNIKMHNIRLDSQVNLIQWNSSDKESAGNIKVTCSNGQILSAAHVIVAVPLGHLKENMHALFVPSLPATKVNAMQKVGFGTVSKVFLLYNSPLESIPIKLICPKNISTFETTVYIRSVSPNILELTSVGNRFESMADQNIIQEVTRIMRMDSGSDFPLPYLVYKSSWSSDPLYRGSHPYLTTHCQRKYLRDLMEPVLSKSGTPLLLFAGDYSNENLDCLVESAYCSGVRETQRLHNFYDEYFGHENINE